MKLWPPHANAPEFIKGSLSVHLDTFTEWAREHLDEKGFIRLDLKEARADKALYLALNTFKKGMSEKPAGIDFPKDDINPDEIPF